MSVSRRLFFPCLMITFAAHPVCALVSRATQPIPKNMLHMPETAVFKNTHSLKDQTPLFTKASAIPPQDTETLGELTHQKKQHRTHAIHNQKLRTHKVQQNRYAAEFSQLVKAYDKDPEKGLKMYLQYNKQKRKNLRKALRAEPECREILAFLKAKAHNNLSYQNPSSGF